VPVFSCGRSLCIDWRMVIVVGGNVLHHVKREGKCPRGECPTVVIKNDDGKTATAIVMRLSEQIGNICGIMPLNFLSEQGQNPKVGHVPPGYLPPAGHLPPVKCPPVICLQVKGPNTPKSKSLDQKRREQLSVRHGNTCSM